MATKKYNNMHQHQPLTTPKNWIGDEARFATQLEEALDDLYRIINRLKLSDLAGDLKLTDNEGNETVAISAGGDITAKTMTADTIVVGGKNLTTVIKETVGEKIIVSDTQPDAHGVVWIKPVAGSGESGEVQEEVTFSGTPSVGNRTGNIAVVGFTLSNKTGSITGDTCKYHVTVRLCNTRGKRILNGVNLRLTSHYGDEPASVEILRLGGLNKLVNAGDYIAIDNEEISVPEELANLTLDSSITVELVLVFSDDGVITTSGVSTVRAHTEDQSGDAFKTCEVYYLK